MRYMVVFFTVLVSGCASMYIDSDSMVNTLSEGTWDFEGNADSCKFPVSFRFSGDGKKLYSYRHNGFFGDDEKRRDGGQYDILSVRTDEIDMNLVGEMGVNRETNAPFKWTIVMLSDESFCWRVDNGQCYTNVSRCPHKDHDT